VKCSELHSPFITFYLFSSLLFSLLHLLLCFSVSAALLAWPAESSSCLGLLTLGERKRKREKRRKRELRQKRLKLRAYKDERGEEKIGEERGEGKWGGYERRGEKERPISSNGGRETVGEEVSKRTRGKAREEESR
jgi:hypothetical protein